MLLIEEVEVVDHELLQRVRRGALDLLRVMQRVHVVANAEEQVDLPRVANARRAHDVDRKAALSGELEAAGDVHERVGVHALRLHSGMEWCKG